MNNVYISELYKGLLVGLNGLIDKTVKIQEGTSNNSFEYREALKFQIELEKTKLNIMQSLPDLFDTKLKQKELVGYDNFGREVFEIKENGDARFVGKLTTADVEVIDNKGTVEGMIVSQYQDALNKINEKLSETGIANNFEINIEVKDYSNSNASQFAKDIMNEIRKK